MPLHVYGVVSTSDQLAGETSGRADRPLHNVDGNGLRVVYSEVDEDHGVRRADLLAHAHVLESLAASATVIPLQFGVVMPDVETVRGELIEQRGEELTGLLKAFDGLVQLSVAVDLVEEEAMREVLRRRRDLADMRMAVQRVPPAEQQKHRVRLGEAVAREVEMLRGEVGDSVVERLAPHARAVAPNEVKGALQAANVALLVERVRRAETDEAVARLREDAGSLVQIRYVGPQPPYSFLETVGAGGVPWD